MTISKKSVLSVSLFVLLLWGVVLSTFATPPLSPYTVTDNTTDPTCAPGSANCYVSSVTADNGLTAVGSNVRLGGTLLNDTTIDTGDNFLQIGQTLPGGGNVGFVTGYSSSYDIGAISLSVDNSTGENAQFSTYNIGGAVGNSLQYNDANTLTTYELSTGDNGVLMSYRYDETVGLDLNAVWVTEYGIRNLGREYDTRPNTQWMSWNSGTNTLEYLASLNNIGNWLWDKYPSTRDDSGSGSPSNFLYTDSSGNVLSAPLSALGGSNWSLSGNTGTTAGTNFIGTTDATDFMVKTNGNQVALFGQNGNVAIGSAIVGFGIPAPSAPALGSIAIGPGANASGLASIALGANGTASGITSVVIGSATASGDGAFAIGRNSTVLASGNDSIAFGGVGTIASGNDSIAFIKNAQSLGVTSVAIGESTSAYSYGENVIGYYNSQYTPASATSFFGSIAGFDRQFSIGNGAGVGSEHNAYTLWKDGSFAYNDDNFQNDDPGTEQNMFYFNYGNHDGLGGAQTNRVIRLGSAKDDEFDINSGNVGDGSIAIGFAIPAYVMSGPIASGIYSTAIGSAAEASGAGSLALNRGIASGSGSTAINGGIASGVASTAFNEATASGLNSFAFAGGSGNAATIASGQNSTAFGYGVLAPSYNEIALGNFNTEYIPDAVDTTFDSDDRLFVIGNGGAGSRADAFTILKNGETGIAIDNFEANTNGNIFQVGDGATNIIGYVDDTTGNWVAVSDERKKDNITDLTYGLDQVLQLRPTSFNYKRNNEHTIGFLAQQVLPIIPEAVYGTESEGYGMSYATLTPVIVKAIQEMNLNITSLSDMTRTNTWRDSLIAWFGNAANGIRSLVVHDKICVDDQCLTKDDIKVLLEMKNGNTPTVPNNPTPPSTPDLTPPSDPLTCTAPQVINQAGDACVDPVVETPQIYTPPSDPLTE